MPLGRSNSALKKKSRSPAVLQKSGPRPFLPPSHYAAAGGIPYTPRTTDSPFQVIDKSEVPSDIPPPPPTRFATQGYESFIVMPMSYEPPEPSSSDSSLERKHSKENRFSCLLSRQSSREKRQSTITGLPDLEAQLLPSLRDTIDRMTRPPSRALPSSNPPSDPSGSKWRDRVDLPQPGLKKLLPSSTIKSDNEPPTPTIPPSQELTPRLRSTSSRPPKSALRAPSYMASSTDLSPNPRASGSSLRTVRSMLGKQTPTPTPSIPPLPSSSRQKSILKRSRTPDVSTSQKGLSPGMPSLLPTFPTLRPWRSATSLGHQRDKTHNSSEHPILITGPKFHSNIPRPKTRGPQTGYHAEDSDFELLYEKQERDRRRLTVMNAEVSMSGSSSESETEPIQHSWDSREIQPHWMNREKPWKKAVGLGFTMPIDAAKGQVRDSILHVDNLRWSELQNDSTSSCEDSIVSLSASESDESQYSDEEGNNPTDDHSTISTIDEFNVDHERRRAALLNIVSGLNGLQHSAKNRYSESSDYTGVHGIAISGSGDWTQCHDPTSDILMTDSDDKEDGSEYEYEYHEGSTGQLEEQSGHLRNMPTFVLSPADDDETFSTNILDPSFDTHCSSSVSGYGPPASSKNIRHSSPSVRFEDEEKIKKSPSRSPVVYHGNRPSIPAALQRYSVYHRHPARNDTDCVSQDLRNNASNGETNFNQSPRDAATIADRSHKFSARARQNLGIPPSESDEVFLKGGSRSSQAESSRSSMGDIYWQDGVDTLSKGAEILLEKLSRDLMKEHQRDSRKPIHSVEVSQSFSDSSIYENVQESEQEVEDEQSLQSDSFDVSESSAEIASIAASSEIHTDREESRLDLIHDLYASEELFSHVLQICVRLFILPLRHQNTRTWITGVPENVARLFDWFEDIANLHSSIYQSLRSLNDTHQSACVFIKELQKFVPRFEVYQPYLVTGPTIIQEIEELVSERSDFGEFVSIQQDSSECERWTLVNLLMEPIKRLSNYEILFNKLLDVTPESHPDYLSTFSLCHSTSVVVRVLEEVKTREEEYNWVKSLSSRIEGLPASFRLASRERRLLHQGRLELCSSGSENWQPQVNTKHSSKLIEAVNNWESRRGRSDSVKSTRSSSTDASSYTSTASTGSSELLETPSMLTSLHISRLHTTPNGRERLAALLAKSTNLIRDDIGSILCPQRRSTTPVYALVFSDLLLLCSASRACNSDVKNGPLTLHQDIGLSKILSCVQVSAKNVDGTDQVFVLKIIPVKLYGLHQVASSSCTGTLRVLRLSLHVSDSSESSHVEQTMYRTWLAAFESSSYSTLKHHSLPWFTDGDQFSDAADDLRRAALNLMASGLPIPRSPSGRTMDLYGPSINKTILHEREQRGWWSTRFQQALNDFRRKESNFRFS